MRNVIAAVLACAVLFGSTSLLQASQNVKSAPASRPAVNLNSATVDQLEALPGIGRRTAERILEYRKKSGFKKIEDLMNVKGIGEKSFLRLKPLVTVGQKSEKPPSER